MFRIKSKGDEKCCNFKISSKPFTVLPAAKSWPDDEVVHAKVRAKNQPECSAGSESLRQWRGIVEELKIQRKINHFMTKQ
jgi:hypothetical protein